MRVVNTTVSYKDRPSGSESKLNTFSDGLKVLRTIFYLFVTYRPMLFFGIISLILFIIALILVIPILSTYFSTGLVPRFPTLIVSGFIGLALIFALVIGFFAKYSLSRDQREFEHKLINIALVKARLYK